MMNVARAKRYFRQLRRDGRMPLLTSVASYLWYQRKNLGDFTHMAEIRQAIADGVPADVEGQVSFVMDRFDGAITPIQNRYEITELTRRLTARRPRRLLEIGTARGGTLFLLCQAAAPDATIISLDLPYGRNGGGFPRWKEPTYHAFARPGQRLILQRGDSHDPASRAAVQSALGGEGLDFILIDGDHSYAGVRADYESYAPLLAPGGMIALHDVLVNRNDPSIDVHRFWVEIAPRHDSEEIVENPDQGKLGIGLLRFAGA